MFCFHKWKIISVNITKSNYEKMKEQGFHSSTITAFDVEKYKLVVLKCEKCGMIKQKKMNEDAIIK